MPDKHVSDYTDEELREAPASAAFQKSVVEYAIRLRDRERRMRKHVETWTPVPYSGAKSINLRHKREVLGILGGS